ncbi:MAG: hypothetical protein GY804_09290 [Alphaproteobacteria bacterium]|nr:hypothetical protein [Alphaproteobacteria bacterium]
MLRLPTERGNAINTPKWNRATSKLTTYKSKRSAGRLRNLNIFRTNGFGYLDRVLSHMDINWLTDKDNLSDDKRYFDYFGMNKGRLDNIFSNPYDIQPKYKVFIPETKGVEQPIEYIIPTSRVNPLSDLPFNTGWSKWSSVKAIKLITHDSPYLPIDIKRGIIFESNDTVPNFMIIAIDVIALGYKFLKYLEQVTETDTSVLRSTFISNEIFGLNDDLMEIYLQHVLKKAISLEPLIYPPSVYGKDFNGGFTELKDKVSKLRYTNIKTLDWLSTRWLFEKSLLDTYEDLYRTWFVPSMRSNEAIKFMMTGMIFSIVKKACMFQPDNTFAGKFLTRADTYINRAEDMKIWSRENVTNIKNEILSIINSA